MRVVETLRSVLRFRAIERDPVARRLRRCVDVADVRRVARRRLPRGVFDYVDGGAEDELTLARNQDAFRALEFRPRVLRGDLGNADTSTMLLGRPVQMPLVLAPAGSTGLVHADGELAVARAAGKAGLPYALSTLSNTTMEDVADVASGPLWFQLYVLRDRGQTQDLLARAKAAGYEAVALTVDTAVMGRRERDLRRGFTLPPQLGPSTIVDGIVHPAWTWAFLRGEPVSFANLRDHALGDAKARPLASISAMFDKTLSWRDLDWLRSVWDGDILIKGIQTVEDAALAADVGVQGIVLSNHGGRQLDGAPPAIELVAPVVDEVGDRLEVICDGGIRRGSDIVKAVALGARACMVGRPYLYGLGAAGERGVTHVLDHLREGMRSTMTLLGAPTVESLNRSHVRWR